MRTTPRPVPRGSALPLALILLGVVTAIAVAAVSLSTQERANAASYSRVDAALACANAAVGTLWAELGVYGTTIAASSAVITTLTLPDGTKLQAPAHYDTAAGATIASVSSTFSSPGAAAASQPARSMENQSVATILPGQTYSFTAHCVDTNGRELEVEVGLKFAL